jgi:hypothetical protein
VDRFTSNTLRTLGIVLISVFVIGGSLIILLLALCFGAIASAGSGTSQHQAEQLFGLTLLGAVILISGGVFTIAKLSRGIVRDTPEYRPPSAMPPPPVSPAAVPPLTASIPAPPPKIERQPAYHVATHLSPSSRAAIQQLSLAIAAKVAAEVLIALAGWIFVRHPLPLAGETVRFGFAAWGLAATAPHLVLLYALLRHPGPRAFAYSLVIPVLHLLFGTFGHSAGIFFLMRSHPGIAFPLLLLTLAPWLLDIVILYMAWKAIRLTGIQPNSTRLIVAAIVIFIYTSSLPALVFLLNYLHH